MLMPAFRVQASAPSKDLGGMCAVSGTNWFAFTTRGPVLHVHDAMTLDPVAPPLHLGASEAFRPFLHAVFHDGVADVIGQRRVVVADTAAHALHEIGVSEAQLEVLCTTKSPVDFPRLVATLGALRAVVGWPEDSTGWNDSGAALHVGPMTPKDGVGIRVRLPTPPTCLQLTAPGQAPDTVVVLVCDAGAVTAIDAATGTVLYKWVDPALTTTLAMAPVMACMGSGSATNPANHEWVLAVDVPGSSTLYLYRTHQDFFGQQAPHSASSTTSTTSSSSLLAVIPECMALDGLCATNGAQTLIVASQGMLYRYGEIMD